MKPSPTGSPVFATITRLRFDDHSTYLLTYLLVECY